VPACLNAHAAAPAIEQTVSVVQSFQEFGGPPDASSSPSSPSASSAAGKLLRLFRCPASYWYPIVFAVFATAASRC